MPFWLICSLIGAAMGLLSGLLGVGGGVIAVPGMIYLLKMDPKLAMGTSLAVIVPVALAGTFKHYMQGNVDFRAVVALAVAGIICGYLGAWLHHAMNVTWLQRCFAVFLLVMGAKMLWDARGEPTARPEPQAPAVEPGEH